MTGGKLTHDIRQFWLKGGEGETAGSLEGERPRREPKKIHCDPLGRARNP